MNFWGEGDMVKAVSLYVLPKSVLFFECFLKKRGSYAIKNNSNGGFDDGIYGV